MEVKKKYGTNDILFMGRQAINAPELTEGQKMIDLGDETQKKG